MALQFSVAVRNATSDAIETTVGTAPTLEFRSGAKPATCATADSGTLLASAVLPSDWMAAASAGAKSLLGLWEDSAADAAGTIGHFRIKQGATCHIQGSVTATGGGGDITLDNPVVAVGQKVTVTNFNLNSGGA